MRVLVTGGAGYIGSHSCKALARAGHVPVVYDNLRTGHRAAVRWGPFEHGDILDTRRLLDVIAEHRIDAVMHFAALAYVGESVERPDLYYHTNVAGTGNLLDAMKAAGVMRMVFSSTCATFGVQSDAPIAEDAEQRPVNPYGRSKLFVEAMLRDYSAAFGLGATMLRYFNAAGADLDGEIGEDHDPETHIIPLTLAAARDGRQRLKVFGTDYPTRDGSCVRDYIHVTDLADAHVRALDRTSAGRCAAYNLGTGTGVSVLELIAAASRVTGREIPFDAVNRRAGDPPFLVADNRLAAEELGWSPAHSDLDTILQSAWAWLERGGFAQ